MMKEFLHEKKFTTLLLSCEHFSYFRQQKEINALKALLLEAAQIEASKVSVCLVLRDPKQFLDSYVNQLKKKGYETSNEELSPYYCREDSWLVDDSAIQEIWESNFDRLDILNYESGNIVPRLCEVMDLPKSIRVNSYFLNKRAL
jgi:hypothetical protein